MRAKLLVVVILMICSNELMAEDEADIFKEEQTEEGKTKETAGQKGDYGYLSKDGTRTKRSTGEENQAQIPADFESTAVQTSYFPGQCLMCPPGGPGPRGPPGQQGLPGRDGRDGRDQPLTGTSANTVGQAPNDSLTGVTYVHWGKTTCPDQSQLVYAGIVGGKHYTQQGSGTNYLCLRSNPTFDRPQAGISPFAAYIYGTEFEAGSYAGLPGLSQEAEVACSVCLATSKQTVLMIPGVNSCPQGQGWTEEYHGYLTANHYGYFATEYICMDHEAEGIPRTDHDNDPSLLYMVEGMCGTNGGGLPCPPYVDGYEITCVVCSL
ncbi:hypothetical protein HOLleu_09251 [Holothuria leucospilota]|uniref:Short-chain collagen C4-like n=1 Tax=Holothuria leucospilota TaxID=206669 RepID=A0A9Q1CIS1_HOLLE|nr:hypothetical protein HOLleu_09251 [Holothuria leucospilota]